MYCTSCKPIVDKQLKNEQAVKKIDIDYMTDSVKVEFDPSFVTKLEIKDKLENLATSLLESILLMHFD
jgi:copper chaperone